MSADVSLKGQSSPTSSLEDLPEEVDSEAVSPDASLGAHGQQVVAVPSDEVGSTELGSPRSPEGDRRPIIVISTEAVDGTGDAVDDAGAPVPGEEEAGNAAVAAAIDAASAEVAGSSPPGSPRSVTSSHSLLHGRVRLSSGRGRRVAQGQGARRPSSHRVSNEEEGSASPVSYTRDDPADEPLREDAVNIAGAQWSIEIPSEDQQVGNTSTSPPMSPTTPTLTMTVPEDGLPPRCFSTSPSSRGNSVASTPRCGMSPAATLTGLGQFAEAESASQRLSQRLQISLELAASLPIPDDGLPPRISVASRSPSRTNSVTPRGSTVQVSRVNRMSRTQSLPVGTGTQPAEEGDLSVSLAGRKSQMERLACKLSQNPLPVPDDGLPPRRSANSSRANSICSSRVGESAGPSAIGRRPSEVEPAYLGGRGPSRNNSVTSTKSPRIGRRPSELEGGPSSPSYLVPGRTSSRKNSHDATSAAQRHAGLSPPTGGSSGPRQRSNMYLSPRTQRDQGGPTNSSRSSLMAPVSISELTALGSSPRRHSFAGSFRSMPFLDTEHESRSASRNKRRSSHSLTVDDIAPPQQSGEAAERPSDIDIEEVVKAEISGLDEKAASFGQELDRRSVRAERALLSTGACSTPRRCSLTSGSAAAQSPQGSGSPSMHYVNAGLSSFCSSGDRGAVSDSEEDDLESVVSYSKRKAYLGRVVHLKWVLTGLSGVLIGSLMSLLMIGAHALERWRLGIVVWLADVDGNSPHGQELRYVLSFLFNWIVTTVAVLLAASLVCLLQVPHASGSGMPEVKAYLNGVSLPKAFTVKTFMSRFVGLLLVTSSGLFVGVEGCCAHLGACICMASTLAGGPGSFCSGLSVLDDYRNRCEFVSQGAAMGIAACFGAPFSGVVMMFEETATLWKQALVWRTFVGCGIAATVSRLIRGQAFKEEHLDRWAFLDIAEKDIALEMWAIASYVLLGMVVGALGGLLCDAVRIVGSTRLRLVASEGTSRQRRFNRLAEAAIIAGLTAAACLLLPMAFGCRPIDGSEDGVYWQSTRQWRGNATSPGDFRAGARMCAEGYVSDFMFLVVEPKKTVLAALFSSSHGIGEGSGFLILVLVAFLVFALTLATFGSALPCGLFIPNMLCGACLGRWAGFLLQGLGCESQPGLYAALGAAGMLAGCSRLTISLACLMVEITGNLHAFLPVLIVIMTSKMVADTISPSVNQVVLGLCPGINMLSDDLSDDHIIVLEGLTVHDACTTHVVVLREYESVGDVLTLLKQSSFAGYPVVDHRGRLVSLVTRLQLVNALADERNRQAGGNIAVRRLTSTMPEITGWSTPVARAFQRFRATSLQHLCVVDEEHVLIGILTRTDFARLCRSGREGVEDVRLLISRKQAAVCGIVKHGTDGRALPYKGGFNTASESSCSEAPSMRSAGDGEYEGSRRVSRNVLPAMVGQSHSAEEDGVTSPRVLAGKKKSTTSTSQTDSTQSYLSWLSTQVSTSAETVGHSQSDNYGHF
eukprot:TRINITY_DN110921_c0_g1_i1.p1 TRINITY_DN110921_c0_g1~~TRINITY_DN110921_c0_g1_i1.p1  ORF type:complete len:1495 (+),score=222.71 TRINITY_DN110921_c0_g1_i1:80-4564(+)